MTVLSVEREATMFGVVGKMYEVQATERFVGSDPCPDFIKRQVFKTARDCEVDSTPCRIVVEVRLDDPCGNKHEDFAITADTYEGGRWVYGGRQHEEIAKHFPELAHLIKWHLCGVNGPMHYLANTVYNAGDRDSWGLRKGEVRQIRNGKTGELAWKRVGAQTEYADGPTCPEGEVVLKWEPWNRVGEGKDRDLDAARHCAVWPEATDEELMQEPEELKKALAARLPSLLAEFKKDMLAAGFIWPEWREELK